MDLLRSAIESFYYNYPSEVIAKSLLYGEDEKEPLDILVEIVKWNNPEFTYSELSLLGKILESDWIIDNEFGISTSNKSFLSRMPLLLNVFGRESLICSNLEYPRVKFNHLLRWRSTSLMLGEDLFTIPFLARLDLNRNLARQDFAWPNIIDHDNFRLNSILGDMLSDTHSHINAALDVSEFNWITLMNNPLLVGSLGKVDRFLKNGARQEYDIVGRRSSLNLDLSQWVVIAAAIRLWIYSVQAKTNINLDFEMLKNILSDESELHSSIQTIINTVERFGEQSLKLNVEGNTGETCFFDYAITECEIYSLHDTRKLSSPFLIHYGERKLLYKWFYGYYGNDGDSCASEYLMLMYLLIKAKVRREFIQTNALSGFRNFQLYQDRKFNFLAGIGKSKLPYYAEIAYRYAIQSSLGKNWRNNIEARITPGSIKDFRRMDYRKSIFKTRKSIPYIHMDKVSFIVHFIKRLDEDDPKVSIYRHETIRAKLWEETKLVVEEYNRNDNTKYPDITGIDAAGDELACRPEVFAPMFRYARHCGISRFTFHAGEDFYDVVDGLRTIKETMEFLDYSMGDRIGHGLALGVNTSAFYEERHHLLIIPCQVLLDNLIWLKYQTGEYHINLSSDTELLIESYFNELGRKLGYFDISTNMYEYYCSMKLRGNIIPDDKSVSIILSDDICRSRTGAKYDTNETIYNLWLHYERNTNCRMKGAEPVTISLHKSYGNDIAMLQEALLFHIENEGIVIETNPSSNLKIGRFSRYDEHPITIFNSVESSPDNHSIVVSINTDDKGVFSTSLTNEYSLIAISLKKQKDANGNRLYSEGQIEDYLRRIASYSNITRF